MFTIPKRVEDHERYETNREINNLIEKAFKRSVTDFSTNFATGTYLEGLTRHPTVNNIRLLTNYSRDIPYGTSTLFNAGCAVSCLQQALNFSYSLNDLAKEVSEAGYYEPNKGTWHNLFDHMGCRRVSHIQEIIDAIMMGATVTCLVNNKVYHLSEQRSGRTFVNCVGFEKGLIVVDDPYQGRLYRDFILFVSAVDIAWIWSM